MSQGQIGSTETPDNSNAARRTKKSPAPRRVTNFDLDRMRKQLRTILGREILSLMDASYRKRLHPKAADTLIKYTRLVGILLKEEKEEMKGLSGKELENMLRQARTPQSQPKKIGPIDKPGETETALPEVT